MPQMPNTAEDRAKKGNGESLRERIAARVAAAKGEASKTGAGAERVASSALADRAAFQGAIGSVDDRRTKSRTQEMAERAERAGRASAPTDHTLDLGTGTGVATEMARGSIEPDWNDNPEHLDTPAEVRADLRASGLDPMDTETEDEAMFGHFLVHSFADDRDRGGRSPAQLEAEHDMVVAAMLGHGVEHRSPLDIASPLALPGRGGGQIDAEPFAFDDPFGLSRGGD